MKRQMFQSVSSQAPLGTRQRYTVPLSIAGHAALLAVLIVVPVVATGAIPLPSSVLVFTAPSVASPPEPPPPASTAISPPRELTEISADAAPTVSPSVVGPELPRTIATNVGGIPPMPGLTTASGPGITRPPAAPAVDTPRRVGGDVQAPRRIVDVPPIYPAIARAARVAGDVILEATIAKDGSVRDVKVLRSVPMLDEAAMTAVRAWRYSAPTLNGTPIEVLMTVTVRFGLR